MTTNGNEVISFIKQMEERDVQVAKHLKELQDQLAEEKSEEVAKLRKVLVAAKEKLVEQKEVLDRLTSEPLVRVPIVSVSGGDRTLLQEGTIVKIRPGFRYEDEIGTITSVEFEDGQLSSFGVQFKDDDWTYKPQQRVQCVPAEEGDIAETIQAGKEVIGTDDLDGDHRGKRHKILSVDEDQGTVLVRCPNQDFRDHTYFYRPQRVVDVVRQPDEYVVIVYGGEHVQVRLPINQVVSVGDIAVLSMKTLQIVEVVTPVALGEPARVRQIMDNNFVEVEYNGSTRVAASGALAGSLEEGDRVLLDLTMSVVLLNLGKEDHRFSFSHSTNVTWNDVGGLAKAKEQMIEAVEMPFKYQDVYAKYGKKPIKGVLLYGPPGCGKTLLAKAAATSLAQLHESDGAETGFIYVKGPEVLDRYVGVAEATVRQIFMQARKHKETHGYPAVIFIDEADAILGKRGNGISSDMERTIVPMFLAEMDGLEDSGAMVLLSTNRPDILDSAITRDGRIDRKVKVDRPDRDSAVEVFNLHLRGVPFNNGYTITEIAELGRNELFADRNRLYDIHVRMDNEEKVIPFMLRHLINGAMIAGVVDQATSLAIHRDISGGGREGGITRDDIVGAVNCIFEQNRDLNHQDELSEFIRGFQKDVVQIKRSDRAIIVSESQERQFTGR